MPQLIGGLLYAALLFVILLVLTRPLGAYMARVFAGERTVLSPILVPVERAIYRVGGIDPRVEQRWTSYAAAVLLFSLVGMLALYALQRLQHVLPLDPQQLGPLSPDLAFGEAASFVTNTNWQSYVPETTVGYLTQMAGYAVQNFVSAATGMAVAIALVRGLARRRADSVGSFWVDLVRATLYVLLPLALLFALVLVWQGVPQSLAPYTEVRTIEGEARSIAQGPVASQEAIKLLGTNGGGFFNANSAHPFENPTPLSNALGTLAMLVIAAGLTYTFGRMVGDQRQGWVLWGAMMSLLAVGFVVALVVEQAGNPLLTAVGVDQVGSDAHSAGNMEGKEVRFGAAASALWAVVTTGTSTGAVNAMHDSFLPLAGLVPLLNMQLGEVLFGGVGAGLYGMLVYALLAVFIAGLMVGRTPEYLGKKVQPFEMKMVMLVVLVPAASILGFSAVASVVEPGTAGISNLGPHGLSQILYAYTSATANNGSAFAGLSANTPFYNISLGVAELIGRFVVIVAVLALAGSMARKQPVPQSLGTLPTHGPLFVGLLIGTVLIVGALTFFPVLALGPIVEQLLLHAGRTY